MSENKENIQYINDPSEIPEQLSDEEQFAFWETHGLSEKYIEKTTEISEEERPRSQTVAISLRWDSHSLNRLKAMADSRNVGYQTLLKLFVQERLYEEEKRQGIIGAVETSPVVEPRAKRMDFRKQAHEFIKENKEVLEDPDITSIALSRLASDAASLLREISIEIKDNSRKRNFPAARLNRQVKAYDALKPFVEKSLALYEEKFGNEEVEESPQVIESAETQEAKHETSSSEEQATGESVVGRLRGQLVRADNNVVDARHRFAQ